MSSREGTLVAVPGRTTNSQKIYAAGFSLMKAAGDAVPTYSLSGRLYLSSSGWLLLAVPNNLVRGAFEAMHEPGVALPPDFNAHVSVCRPEEVEAMGGPEAITERGKTFRYQLGPIKTVEPAGWSGMSRVWFISVTSPELSAFRRSYGLPSQPRRGDEELPFHITVAVRRKHILNTNEVSKAAGLLDSALAFTEPLGPSNRSFFLAAARETPMVWDHAKNPLTNLWNHVQNVRKEAKRRIHEQNRIVTQRAKSDKDYATNVRLHELQGSPDTAEPGWIDRAIIGLPSEPFVVEPPQHKKAEISWQDLGHPWGQKPEFFDALKRTPFHYQPEQSLLNNVRSHLQRAQGIGQREIRDHAALTDYRLATDPQFSREQFAHTLLTGEPAHPQPGWLDSLLLHTPLGDD